MKRFFIPCLLALLASAQPVFAKTILFVGNSFTFGALSPVQTYKAGEQQVDLDVKYNFSDTYSFTVGGQNIFDNYPDRDSLGLLTNGNIYRDGPVDIQGGFYYMRVDAKF